MTSRERMLTAISNQQPDCIPVSPDISNMVPCRLTGKPFWKIYMDQDPALWKAYIDAVRYFGIDGWLCYGEVHLKSDAPVQSETVETRRDGDRYIRRLAHRTAGGDLFSEWMYFPADSPYQTEKMVKDIVRDLPKLRHLYPDVTGYDDTVLKLQRKEMGESGVVSVTVPVPGFHNWADLFHGGLEAVTYAFADHPDEMEELRRLQHRYYLRCAEMIIAAKPDLILTVGSGALTLQSPDLYRRLSLPTQKAICEMAAQAGVLTMAHCCGRERDLVKMSVEETMLNCINPLEEPPMGDCELAEIKRTFGDRISLMGNLHTTNVMLRGTLADVERAAMKAIDDAAAGGGFILSTGDQCGRDTPDENIFKLVEVAHTYGRYE